MATTNVPPSTTQDSLPPLLHMITGYWVSQALYVAAKLELADRLSERPQSSDELSQTLGVDAHALYRLLRTLASVGIFTESEEKCFSVTPLGTGLQSAAPGSLHALALLFGEPWVWEAWGHLLLSVKTGKVAFTELAGIDWFTYCKEFPEVGVLFNRSMTTLVQQMHAPALAAYDFTPFRTIVDVGGGQGALLTRLLTAYPHLQGVLFDQPQVIANAQSMMATNGCAARCVLVGGDFFQTIPTGGDAYVLAHILHNWDDTRAATILTNVHAAMTPSGKLLILEQVLPSGDAPHFGKWMDLNMLVMLGGQERTASEFQTLLARAGFGVTRILPTASPLSIIEGVRMDSIHQR